MTAIKSVPVTHRLDEHAERERDAIPAETTSGTAVVA